MDTMETRAAVAAAARELAARGLSLGTTGNVSARVGEHFAVTATGLAFAEASAEGVSVVDAAGKLVDGTLAPTSELGLHHGVYAIAPQAGGIVHMHAPFAAALSVVIEELPVLHYDQLALGGSIRVAPFATFGTPELAAHVERALAGRKAALMANHGAVVWGETLDVAMRNALLLEWLCTLYYRARTLGEPKALTETEQQAVLDQAARLSYGRTHEP